MTRFSAFLIAALLAVGLAGSAASADAPDPEPGTVDWYARDADNMVYSTGRMVDQLANPLWAAQFWTETLGDYPADPYRQHWSGERGIAVPIEYTNRYGARVTGHLWAPKPDALDPVTSRPMRPPYPGIVITNGSVQAYEELYWWAAQGLAEAGYLVMTWDPQGQGHSETLPNPLQQFCDPNGDWKKPQEDGVSETGPCAGVPFQQSSNFTFGIYDALKWLLSDANPLRDSLDEARIGLAGHSLGAGAVTLVGNADPRVKAVVAWDAEASGLGVNLSANVRPRVPTMRQNADYFVNPTPAIQQPDPDSKNATFRRLREAGVPAMQVALRGSTHMEWEFLPYLPPASRKGERIAMYYTLAWFDRWVKGPTDGRQKADAIRRLAASVFDQSSDRSSIGLGSWDSAKNANVPYLIAGECVKNHLSIYYMSSWAVDGVKMGDMRKALGCSARSQGGSAAAPADGTSVQPTRIRTLPATGPALPTLPLVLVGSVLFLRRLRR